MSADLWATTIVWVASSHIGAGLLAWVWYLQHGDRVYNKENPDPDPEMQEKQRTAAIRNEVVAAVLTFVCLIWAVVGDLSLYYLVHGEVVPLVYVPWVRFGLTLGNVAITAVGGVKLWARRKINE